jgi:hypothetical protein
VNSSKTEAIPDLIGLKGLARGVDISLNEEAFSPRGRYIVYSLVLDIVAI